MSHFRETYCRRHIEFLGKMLHNNNQGIPRTPLGRNDEAIFDYFKFVLLRVFIAELAERSPITIRNSSNPSSRKKIWLYDRTIVRPYVCFHAFYSIRSNFRKWFVSQNMEPLSLLSTSRGIMMNMLAIRYFFLMLETEKLISKIGIHQILQEASEL